MSDLETTLSLIDRFYNENSPEFIENFFAGHNTKDCEVVTLDEYLSSFETAYAFTYCKKEYLYDELVVLDSNINDFSSCEIINIDYDLLVKGETVFNHSYEPLAAA